MRLIDADALCRYANNLKDRKIDANDIMRFPRVDAMPVVRCKECKYWQDNNGGYPHDWCKWREDETPDSDDFCSFGELRGEKDE